MSEPATVAVSYTVLYGTGKHEPLCSLLKVDDVNILLDCGWNDTFDEAVLAPLKRIAPEVDVVVLSHADIEHCGALPYAVSKLGLTSNVYCTQPVQRMGQMFVVDALTAALSCRNITSFSVADVERVFTSVKAMRYQQEVEFRGVKFTALRAGRTIGGSIWRITKLLEDIVYAVDYNPKNDTHLNRTTLSELKRPSILITDASNALTDVPRTSHFVDAVFRTLSNGGNVLLPTDTAGRVLELALCLDLEWNKLLQSPQFSGRGVAIPLLYIVSNAGARTFEFAKTLVEWLNDRWSKQFDVDKSVPYAFRYARVVPSLDDIKRDRTPKAVLASLGDMTVGFAKDLFLEWCSNPNNTVLFTARSKKGTLANVVRKCKKHNTASEFFVDVPVITKSVMAGDELEAWLAQKRAEREKDARDVEVRKRLEEERRELELETRLTDDLDMSGGAASASAAAVDELEEGQVPWAEANARSYLFDIRHAMFSCDDDDAPVITPYGEALEADFFGPVVDIEKPATTNLAHWHTQAAVAASEREARTVNVIDGFVVPPKFTETLHAATVRCGIEFVDMEGRADKQSISTIMESVTPITTVIVRGSAKAKEFLREKCEERSAKVIVPAQGAVCDVSSRTVMFTAGIWDDVFASLKFQTVGGLDAAYVEGMWEKADMADSALSLRHYPEATEGHRPVFLRKEVMKMRELQRKLVRDGVKIEFQNHVLVTSGTPATAAKIREASSSHSTQALHLEGTLNDDFFKIRDAIYSMHSVV